MISGILESLPSIVSGMSEVVLSLITLIWDNMPQFLAKGSEIIVNMITGIAQQLPSIVGKIVEVVAQLIAEIATKLPDFLTKGVEMLVKVAEGIVQAIPDVLKALGDMASEALSAMKEVDWLSVGVDVINGIVNGIKSIGNLIADTLTGLAKGAWKSLKDFFGIASPSKLMRDTVGRYLPEGIAVGIEANAYSVTDAIDELSDETAAAFSPKISASSGTVGNASLGMIEEIRSLKDAITGMQVVLDTGAMVGGLAPDMDTALGTFAARSRKGI